MTTTFKIRSYGATGDTSTNDEPAIQAAIDAAAENDGGTALVPSGATYLPAPISDSESVTIEGFRGESAEPERLAAIKNEG